MNGTKAAIELMKGESDGGGVIVNIASVAGRNTTGGISHIRRYAIKDPKRRYKMLLCHPKTPCFLRF